PRGGGSRPSSRDRSFISSAGDRTAYRPANRGVARSQRRRVLNPPMLAQSYARTYRANAVLTASPGQLVLMLFDGTLKALALAQQAFLEPSPEPRRIENINRHLL